MESCGRKNFRNRWQQMCNNRSGDFSVVEGSSGGNLQNTLYYYLYIRSVFAERLSNTAFYIFCVWIDYLHQSRGSSKSFLHFDLEIFLLLVSFFSGYSHYYQRLADFEIRIGFVDGNGDFSENELCVFKVSCSRSLAVAWLSQIDHTINVGIPAVFLFQLEIPVHWYFV